MFFFWCQAEDGIRDLVRSRGLGDVYKRQEVSIDVSMLDGRRAGRTIIHIDEIFISLGQQLWNCLLYTSDAADERSSVDLGGRRIIKKKTKIGVT